MAISGAALRHSCAKLSVAVEDPKTAGGGAIFVKATWLPTRFSLAVTDGAGAWVADASDAEVRLRAEQWDQPVAEYLALAERYLAFHQPSSTYSFHDAGNGHRRLSWTFERQGTKLEWRWKLQPSPNTQQTIAEILDFLMDANIRLSEEVVRKTQSFDKLKQESEKCLQQSERFNTEKAEFEQATFSKGDKNSIVQSAAIYIHELKGARDQLQRKNEELKEKLLGHDSQQQCVKVQLEVDEPSSPINSMIGALRCLKSMSVKTRGIRSDLSGRRLSTVMNVETTIAASEVEKAVEEALKEVERNQPDSDIPFPGSRGLSQASHVQNVF